MFLFDNFFHKQDDDDNKPEEPLNEVLRQLDKQRFEDEIAYDYFDKDNRTVFDVLAYINKLRHLRGNVYVNKEGKHYVRTKMGFQVAELVNNHLQNTQLKRRVQELERKLCEKEIKPTPKQPAKKYENLLANYKLLAKKMERLKPKYQQLMEVVSLRRVGQLTRKMYISVIQSKLNKTMRLLDTYYEKINQMDAVKIESQLKTQPIVYLQQKLKKETSRYALSKMYIYQVYEKIDAILYYIQKLENVKDELPITNKRKTLG